MSLAWAQMGTSARLTVRHEVVSLFLSIALTALGLYGVWAVTTWVVLGTL